MSSIILSSVKILFGILRSFSFRRNKRKDEKNKTAMVGCHRRTITAGKGAVLR